MYTYSSLPPILQIVRRLTVRATTIADMTDRLICILDVAIFSVDFFSRGVSSFFLFAPNPATEAAFV